MEHVIVDEDQPRTETGEVESSDTRILSFAESNADSRSTIEDASLDERLFFVAKEIRMDISNLSEYISDKEQKKLFIFRYSTAALPILGAAFVAAFTFISTNILQNPSVLKLASFNVVSFFVISSILILAVSIIKYLATIKSDVVLAVRQLNCSRNGLYSTLELILDLPLSNGQMLSDEMLKKIGMKSLFGNLIGSHNKFPTDNDKLKKVYRERKDSITLKLANKFSEFLFGKLDDKEDLNSKAWLRRAVKNGQYRTIFFKSADLFSILSIGIAAIAVSFLPLLGNLYMGLSSDKLMDNSIWLWGFSTGYIFLIVWFGFKMIKTLFDTVESIDEVLASNESFENSVIDKLSNNY